MRRRPYRIGLRTNRRLTRDESLLLLTLPNVRVIIHSPITTDWIEAEEHGGSFHRAADALIATLERTVDVSIVEVRRARFPIWITIDRWPPRETITYSE